MSVKVRISFGLALFLALFFMFAALVFAESKIVSVTIDNPDGPLDTVQVIFSIPFGLTPINLDENMIWNESSRQLEIDAGEFKEEESKEVSFELEGEPGRYLVGGKITGLWPATDLLPEETFEGIIDTFAVVFEEAAAEPAVADFVDALRQNTQLIEAAETVGRSATVVLGAIGVSSIVVHALSSSAALASEVARLLSYVGLGLFRMKRRKPWGRVYDQFTNTPVGGAVVRIYDTKFKLIKETQTSDALGRFGFMVSPGEYYIKVLYPGYIEKQTDVLKIARPEEILQIDIPLVAIALQAAPKELWRMRFKQNIKWVLEVLNTPIMILGTLLSIAVAILLPGVFHYVLVVIYVLLWLVKLVLHTRHLQAFGRVLDRATNKPVALSVVRLYSADRSWLLATRVTDQSGKFQFLANSGAYYVMASREGYASFQSQPITLTKADVFARDIKLDKLR